MDEIADSIRGQYSSEPLGGPLQILIVAFRTRPKSKRKQVFVDVKPDADNVWKLVADAATQSGVVWGDDSQIVDGRCVKLYAPVGVPGWIELFIRRHPAAALAKLPGSFSGQKLWEAMSVA